ncbi:MAG: hypothetical protein H7345_08085 [Rubritepida sp.]|nr:hypothetical protein [Rubritepida sp.]
MIVGPVGRVLARTTAPLALALLVMFGLQLAEAWLIGRLGGYALAALGFVLPVVMTSMSFGIGLGAGASAVVARAIGAGGHDDAARLSRHVLVLAGGLGLLVSVPGWLAAPWLLDGLGASGEARDLALAYLRLWLPGLVPLLVGMAALSLLRAAGDTAFQGAALAGAGALSFALDFPLGLYWLGFPGFALAASLGWSVMLVAALWRLRSLGLLGATGGGFLAAARRVLRIGVPAAAANAIIPLAAGIYTAMLAAQGDETGPAAVAGFALGSRTEALAMTAFFALSAIANPFAAQNAGAGRMDRVAEGVRLSLIFCAVAGLALAVPLWFAADWIAARFTDDPAVTASAALYLRIMPFGFGAVGVIAVVSAALNGLERPLAAVAVSLARTFAIGVPLAWLGGRLGGEAGLLGGILAANIIVGVGAALFLLRAADQSSFPAGAVKAA